MLITGWTGAAARMRNTSTGAIEARGSNTPPLHVRPTRSRIERQGLQATTGYAYRPGRRLLGSATIVSFRGRPNQRRTRESGGRWSGFPRPQQPRFDTDTVRGGGEIGSPAAHDRVGRALAFPVMLEWVSLSYNFHTRGDSVCGSECDSAVNSRNLSLPPTFLYC
jgi:hypothetical protein